jgi:hypothetical protein
MLMMSEFAKIGRCVLDISKVTHAKADSYRVTVYMKEGVPIEIETDDIYKTTDELLEKIKEMKNKYLANGDNYV